MRRLRTAVFAVLTALSSAPAMGQRPGTVEVGGFGAYTRFDRSLAFDNGFGGGGWLGIFIAPGLALEGSGLYIPTTSPGSTDATLIPLNARLVFAQPVAGPVAVLVGAGYVHNMYGRTGNVSDDGVSGLFGLRFGLGPNVAIRIAAVEDFIPSPRNQSGSVSNNWNFAVQGGLSALLGKSSPKDGDRDGLADGMDACPNTQPGDAVDSRGCSLPKDGDADGVVDANDRCGNSPPGDKVDARGCSLPKDADGDAIADAIDRCPGTRPAERVDAAGCPMDSDGDGVVDSADKCPATPAGEKIDAAGCPLPKDSDMDGVHDPVDRCARTPAGERVDTNGCPVLFNEGQRTLVLQGVTFQTGSPLLTAQARAALERIAISLAAQPGLRVEVAGYTDDRGSSATNLRLSRARADAVRGYLIERGVGPDQLTAQGFGEGDPIDTNATASGRSRNRRVELHRFD